MRALPRTGTTTATAVAAAVLLALTGCGRQHRPTTADGPSALPSVSPPTDPRLDYRDATAVCLRFADAVYRRDAGTDPSAQTAYRRAMAYATGELAAAVATQPERSNAQWATWRAHRAVSDPTVTAVLDDDQPADGAALAYRAAQVTVTPAGADGWRGPTEAHLMYCTLRHDDSGWRVERYDVSDTGSGTP